MNLPSHKLVTVTFHLLMNRTHTLSFWSRSVIYVFLGVNYVPIYRIPWPAHHC